MLFRKIPVLLFILFAATAVASRKKSRPGEPQTTCVKHESGEVRDTYTIRGRNWNVTEAQVKDAINSPGTVLTAWEWRSAMDEDGALVFKAKVSFLRELLRACRMLTRLFSSGFRFTRRMRRRRNWRS